MEGRLYLKVPPVYLVDDVQMTGQQAFEEVNGPALQCLRQDSVIGVRTGPHHNVPGLEMTVEGPVTPGETADVRSRASRQRWVRGSTSNTDLFPAELFCVHKDPHQFGNGQSGMGVVQLDGHLRTKTQNADFSVVTGNVCSDISVLTLFTF